MSVRKSPLSTVTLVTTLFLATAALAPAQNLLKNGSFEECDRLQPSFPASWTETIPDGEFPLSFASEHYEGATSAMLEGDRKTHEWRQIVLAPAATQYTLSAMVKAEEATVEQDGFANLSAYILYKGRPPQTATRLNVKFPAGTYDWRKVSVSSGVRNDFPIDSIVVTISGKLGGGRMMVDLVSLTGDKASTPESLLLRKVNDLLKQLDRIGQSVDSSVAESREHLVAAKVILAGDVPDLNRANSEWIAAANAVSHAAWAAMYPDAMSDNPVEAHMIYHGQGETKEECDRYLDLLQKANANGAYLSIGGWESVTYRSDLIPTAAGYDGDFDGLQYFIAQAHQRGIKVFGYISAFGGTFTAPSDPRSIYHTHPEWFAHGRESTMPLFPDPANPAMDDFLTRVYAEAVTRYPLDGIGLDFIRYPGPSYLNYDENNRRQIRQRFGFDIMEGGDQWLLPKHWEKIKVYRAEKILDFIKAVRNAVKAARPRTALIGCLLSDPDEAFSYGQDWKDCAFLLDYASPMNYDDVSLNEDLLARQREMCAADHTVFIPAIGGMPQVHQSWTISTWAERVAIQRRVGCDGMIIYRIADLDPAVAAFFGKGPYYVHSRFPDPMAKP
jgi:uncharacterized lipoprotein YddW (UPF0748 family)